MWRPMRRSGQQLPDKETETILACGREGVLAVTDSEGWPYAVPVNYCWKDGKIIIHSAREGHKIDAVRENDKVSFCVVAEKAVIPEKYTTAYKSAIVFGRARLIEDPEAMLPFLDALAERFTGAPEEERQAYIRKYLACVAVIMIEPEHITGKEGSLPAEARRKAARPEPVPADGGEKDTAALLEDGRKRAGAVAALAESLSWRVKFRDDPEKEELLRVLREDAPFALRAQKTAEQAARRIAGEKAAAFPDKLAAAEAALADTARLAALALADVYKDLKKLETLAE